MNVGHRNDWMSNKNPSQPECLYSSLTFSYFFLTKRESSFTDVQPHAHPQPQINTVLPDSVRATWSPRWLSFGKQWLHAIRLVLGPNVAINTAHRPCCSNDSAVLWFSLHPRLSINYIREDNILMTWLWYELQHRSVDRLAGSVDSPNHVTLLRVVNMESMSASASVPYTSHEWAWALYVTRRAWRSSWPWTIFYSSINMLQQDSQ